MDPLPFPVHSLASKVCLCGALKLSSAPRGNTHSRSSISLPFPLAPSPVPEGCLERVTVCHEQTDFKISLVKLNVRTQHPLVAVYFPPVSGLPLWVPFVPCLLHPERNNCHILFINKGKSFPTGNP